MKARRYHFTQISSTNTFLRELQERAESPGQVVVVADYQDHGRGQGSNAWVSEAGKNLLMSFLIHPAFLSASHAFQLSRMAALALCDMLEGLDLGVEIKWPNDILLEGKKVAGMLIENGLRGQQLDYSIVGIGLNVQQLQFPGFPRQATSLALEWQKRGEEGELDLASLSLMLEESFFRRFAALESEPEAVEREYTRKLYGLDKDLFFEVDGKRLRARIRGVNQWGQLCLQWEGSMREFDMHGLRFLD